MKLIKEITETVSYLVEEADGKKSLHIEGPFLVAEKKNRNGRLYEYNTMKKEVARYTEEYINKHRAFGELGHPESPSINLDKVSHRITNLSWDGNDVLGKALILNTPMGIIVKGLLEGGCQLGVSSRGMGTVAEKNGKTTVNDDFVLSTVDIVQDPSAPSAFVNGIMEGVEYFYEGNSIVAVTSDQYKKIISKMPKAQLAEQQIKLFSNFLKDINL